MNGVLHGLEAFLRRVFEQRYQCSGDLAGRQHRAICLNFEHCWFFFREPVRCRQSEFSASWASRNMWPLKKVIHR